MPSTFTPEQGATPMAFDKEAALRAAFARIDAELARFGPSPKLPPIEIEDWPEDSDDMAPSEDELRRWERTW